MPIDISCPPMSIRFDWDETNKIKVGIEITSCCYLVLTKVWHAYANSYPIKFTTNLKKLVEVGVYSSRFILRNPKLKCSVKIEGFPLLDTTHIPQKPYPFIKLFGLRLLTSHMIN